jgi:hypothetical protein
MRKRLFSKKNLNDRYYHREYQRLINSYQIPLNPSKQKLKELKIEQVLIFFINISSKKK